MTALINLHDHLNKLGYVSKLEIHSSQPINHEIQLMAELGDQKRPVYLTLKLNESLLKSEAPPHILPSLKVWYWQLAFGFPFTIPHNKVELAIDFISTENFSLKIPGFYYLEEQNQVIYKQVMTFTDPDIDKNLLMHLIGIAMTCYERYEGRLSKALTQEASTV